MSICSNLRFKWRLRRTILALQSAGYVTLPPEDETVIGYHWADPWNSVTVQVSRSDVQVGQVTCYPGSSESDEGGVPLASRTVWGWPVTVGGWQYVSTVGELRAVALVHASRVRADY